MKKEILFFMCLTFLFSVGLQAQNYHSNIDTVRQTAEENEHLILMIFSGSDWCKPCMQMKENILEETSFREFANEHLEMLLVDFPYRKKNRLPKEQQKHNDALAEQYNPEGTFPLLVLTDAKGNIIKRMGYDRQLGPETYIELIQEKSH